MDAYEQKVFREAEQFVRSLRRKSSILQRSSKNIQIKINNKIPEKVHHLVTESIKTMIQLALTSSEYIRSIEVNSNWTLEQRENKIKERLNEYTKAAMIEGAGTGAGGLLLGMADFPLLLSIKMKFLFDVAQIHGYNVQRYEERMYLLHVFLLAFSSDNKRREVLEIVLTWDSEENNRSEIDWKTMQIEYRDSIDFVKMLQLVPGFGAIIGVVANRKLLAQLGETAINMYRLRSFKQM